MTTSVSIVWDTVETTYSIDLCPHDLITKSWQRSRVATRKQYSFESVAVSMKQISVVVADYSNAAPSSPLCI